MSATNVTPNIELPVFVGTDKPAWLTDWNGAMNKIDAAVGSAETDISGLETAVATQGQSITSLTNTVGQHTTSIQALTTATTHNAGDINTINSLIGNGEPTTTDKTLIGAINELYDDIHEPGGGVEAENVSYDNTTSGLTATDVQAAIDELASGSPTPVPTYDFNLTAHTGNITGITGATGYTVDRTEYMYYACNNDYSIGKIYGGFRCYGNNVPATWTTVASFNISGLPTPATEYRMVYGMIPLFDGSNFNVYGEGVFCLLFKTDGSIDVQLKTAGSGGISGHQVYAYFDFPPCVMFFTDFGD